MIKPGNILKLIAPVTLGALLLCGCSTRTITYGGATYKSRKLGSDERFGGLSITTTNGTVLKLDAYESEQTQAMSAVVEAAVKAAVKP